MALLRLLSDQIARVLKNQKSVLLLGPRQTGKTTLANQFQIDLSISFLSTRVRHEYEANPDLIIREVTALKKPHPLILVDEVQKVPEIMDPIQHLIDKKKAQFIITGSSARKLKQQFDINLLPGRVIYFRLDAFSLEEYADAPLYEFLTYGNLPEVVLTKDKLAKDDLLRSYVEVYLEEEIRAESRIRKIPDFYRFLEFAAQRDGLVCSYSGIAQDIGVSHVTVKSYYEILESTLIADRIDPITKSSTRKKLIKSPRYLFFDLGIRRISAKEGEPLPTSTMGLVFENFVGLEIQKYIRTHRSLSSLQFWQDPEVAEVDWVIRKEKSFFPIEVKKKSTIKPADCKHLRTFMEEYNCPKGGFVVCECRNRQLVADNIIAVPWAELPTLLKELKI